jgi:hypothetical protein
LRKLIFASVAAIAAIAVASSGALDQAVQTGQITKLEPKGMIYLKHLANGRAGAPTVVDNFKVQDGLAVGNLKAGGDKVNFVAAVDGDENPKAMISSSKAMV